MVLAGKGRGDKFAMGTLNPQRSLGSASLLLHDDDDDMVVVVVVVVHLFLPLMMK